MRKVLAIMTGVIALGACSTKSEVATTGAIAGGNPGVLVDSPVASGAGEPPIGAVEGGLTGADVGRSLSDSDRAIALKAEYEALEYGRAGRPVVWQNPEGDNHGEINVGSSYQVNRLDCREYTHNIWIGGRLRVVKGTACREPEGVWRIVS